MSFEEEWGEAVEREHREEKEEREREAWLDAQFEKELAEQQKKKVRER